MKQNIFSCRLFGMGNINFTRTVLENLPFIPLMTESSQGLDLIDMLATYIQNWEPKSFSSGVP